MWASLRSSALCNRLLLSLFSIFLFFTAGTASALGIELNSENLQPQCIVLQLDTFTPSYDVRFGYHSNINDIHRRSSLVITQHVPEAVGGRLSRASQTLRREVFTPETLLHKQHEMEENGERFAVHVSVEADYFAESDDMAEGGYQCCFSLQRPFSAPETKEVIDIVFLEITPQHKKGNRKGNRAPVPLTNFNEKNMRRVALSAADEEEWISEIAHEVEKVRKGVEDDYKAVKDEDALTAQTLRSQLNLVAETHDMLMHVMADLIHLRGRNARMQRTTESTFTRIWCSAICIIAVIFVVAYGTFAFTKDLLIKRKLV